MLAQAPILAQPCTSFCKHDNGIEVSLEVRPYDSIKIVKDKITAAFVTKAGREPGGKFFLFARSLELQDDRTISDYNINEDMRLLTRSECTYLYRRTM